MFTKATGHPGRHRSNDEKRFTSSAGVLPGLRMSYKRFRELIAANGGPPTRTDSTTLFDGLGFKGLTHRWRKGATVRHSVAAGCDRDGVNADRCAQVAGDTTCGAASAPHRHKQGPRANTW